MAIVSAPDGTIPIGIWIGSQSLFGAKFYRSIVEPGPVPYRIKPFISSMFTSLILIFMVPKFFCYKCLTKPSAKSRLSNSYKVVKPGKRRRGAQRQGELDCLHEQCGWCQYLHKFQQVSAPGSWRPCREGQRSNWDELTEEPRDHGIWRLKNSIKLLGSQCKWKRRYSPQRYCASAPGMNNNWEDGETLFQSKRFPFGEHFWPHIQWPVEYACYKNL